VLASQRLGVRRVAEAGAGTRENKVRLLASVIHLPPLVAIAAFEAGESKRRLPARGAGGPACPRRPFMKPTNWARAAGSLLAVLSACAPCGCSSTVAPSQILVLSGVTVVTPGLSTQLIVKTTPAGAIVSDGLSWSSQAPNVASVSGTGLVTAVAPGSALITARTAAGSGSAEIVVQPLTAAITTVTGCVAISAPGQYVVSVDLPRSVACLTFGAVASAQLDCGGHAVGGVTFSNVNNVSVKNCQVTGTVALTDANSVTLVNCLVTGFINVVRGTNVDITGGAVLVNSPEILVAIWLKDGSNNLVQQVMLTGGYDGGKANVGADDGIVLEDEISDQVTGNVIKDFYDLGVEGIDALANVSVTGNTFSNLGSGAVGSYWCTSWTGNVVRDNQVVAAPTLALVGYHVGPICAAATPASFSNNQFVANVFRSQAAGTLGGPMGPTTPGGPSMSVSMSGQVSNNLVQGNDFGTYGCPTLLPPTGFVDGGGNVCAVSVPEAILARLRGDGAGVR
jgi:hypothetical protein